MLFHVAGYRISSSLVEWPGKEHRMNRWYPFSQLILARFREFYREPEAIFWVYGFPLILAVGLGIAFSGGKPEPPEVDVQGTPDDPQVKSLTAKLRSEGLRAEIHAPDSCRKRFKRGRTAMYIIPHASSVPEVVYDETRSECLLARHWVGEALAHSTSAEAPVLKEILIREPGSRYIDFLLPGLIGMNLMGGGLFGIGFVLVDMRVRKLFKRFLATPMRRGDFLMSILTARMVFLVPEILSLLLMGYFAFGVPISGHLVTLAVIIVIGAMAFNCLGLLIGSRTEKTETASGLINLAMLPMYLLSGVFFSSRRFPDEIQPFIQILPLTQVNDALREVMLEGLDMLDIAWRLLILLVWIVLPLPLALKWFRWR
jgi:ABC-2 type transport system permease protein